MICYHLFVDVLLFAPSLANFLFVTSKAADFGLGNLDQTPSTTAPEPKPSERASSTLNKPKTTPVQAESAIEVAPARELGGQGGVETATAPSGEDTLARTPPGELQLPLFSSILAQHLEMY